MMVAGTANKAVDGLAIIVRILVRVQGAAQKHKLKLDCGDFDIVWRIPLKV